VAAAVVVILTPVQRAQVVVVDQEWLLSNIPIHGLFLTPEVG
jgi:hypothetical protein